MPIDWKAIRVEKNDGNFLVFEGRWEVAKLILELRRTAAGRRLIAIRPSDQKKVGTITRNEKDFSRELMAFLESLTCEVCHIEWGPVCERCFDHAGDETFLLYRNLIKGRASRVDDRRDGKTVYERVPEEP